jgi:hypothetical protein
MLSLKGTCEPALPTFYSIDLMANLVNNDILTKMILLVIFVEKV